MNTDKQTHESYIHAVREIALGYANKVRATPQLQLSGIPALTDEQLTAIEHAKLVSPALPDNSERPWYDD